MAQQEVERPRQAGRRRLVPGEQQRHQLVADLGVVHRLAVLEPRRDQQRQDVLARIGPPRGDLRRRACGRSPAAAPPGFASGSGPPKRRESSTPNCRLADDVPASSSPRRSPSRSRCAGVGDAEHRPQDHLERDRLHPRVQRERLARRPAVDLARDDLAHRRLVRAHARAVKRRQHQLAPREVLAPLEQQQRARPHDRLQRDRAAGRERVPGDRVERADRLGVGEHHHRRLEAEEADAERVAEAPPARLQERDRPQQPAQGLHERRLGRPWRQRAHRAYCRTDGRDRTAPIRRAAPRRRPPPGRRGRRPAGRGAGAAACSARIGNRATTRLLREPVDTDIEAERARFDEHARAHKQRLAEYAQRSTPHVLKTAGITTDSRVDRRRRSGSRPRSTRARSCAPFLKGKFPEARR